MDVYRTNFQGGISTIPATAYWIIRLSSDLSLVTAGMYYPNLSLESVSGVVNYNMSGLSGICTIKGNLDVGVNGVGNVYLNNENTNATACQVLGNLTIADRSKITNYSGSGSTYGNGFDVYGDLNFGGNVDLYFGSGSAKGVLGFKGNTFQNVIGGGQIEVNNLVVNKSASLVNFTNIPFAPVVHEQINLISKNILLNEVDLWLDKNCQVLNASNSSFVQTNGTGTVLRETTSTYPYPVGYSSYNPITITGSGALDYFHARVVDVVYQNGNSGAPFTTNVVNRTWFVTEETAGGNTMNLTVTWYASDELSGFTRTACYVSHYDGSQWNPTANAPAAGTGSGPFTRTRTGQTSFSPFAVGSNGALPVELIEFTAEKQEQTVLLEWSTASERDNAFFEIERSGTGLLFAPIGQVPGAVASTTIHRYHYQDKQPINGLNYYRLKQVDTDGKFAYSPVAEVLMESNAALRFVPMPVSNQLSVYFPMEELSGTWKLYNLLGDLVHGGNADISGGRLDLDLSSLIPGIYQFEFVTGNKPYTGQVIKQ